MWLKKKRNEFRIILFYIAVLFRYELLKTNKSYFLYFPREMIHVELYILRKYLFRIIYIVSFGNTYIHINLN